ncbi:hypothetical protein [Marinobacter subterrani]|uniref:hypothetical protein n=1 Tax=Marinobacter subterrani TaxID=1658765 RepID=UPI0023520534|nr:hypothetical protein [Marinobacter subterrani]
MPYHHELSIRKSDEGCFVYSDACPYLKQALIEYGHLVRINERLTLTDLINRIEERIGTRRARLIVDQIRVWVALMETVTDTLINEGRMPPAINWKQTTYPFEDYLKMLSPEGLKRAILVARDQGQQSAPAKPPENIAA